MSKINPIKIYNNKDLVLQVNKSYDKIKTKFNIDEWETFIDILCDNREYQKEAIRNGVLFLIGGKYKNINDLVIENYDRNDELKNKYKNVDDYLKELEMKDRLFANIDLATGTGKSYVIYGIAQIMLGSGFVDRILVLCPSKTIESGLKEKFEELSGNKNLKNSLPKSTSIKNPRIIDANSTIKEGDICIENIHAVYQKTGSSIYDSFVGKGEKVLVLNDESHHIFNGTENKDKDIKKWKEFLVDNKYNFKYILGFTGTAYHNNNYFNDVIYRYSLKQAIEEGVVKNIEYLKEDDGKNIFQKVFQNHENNKKHYNKIKPITILITKDIAKANELKEEYIDFLCEIDKKAKRENIEEKVLIVTSHKDHEKNIIKLKDVDDKKNKVEYIVSVSMLTEGWDVKNVLQIYPHEERAFNSKLLISQVLGRGLRLPKEYQSPQPKVIVFNHSAWSSKIKSLLDEILEIEIRVSSEVLKTGDRSNFNFDLYNIDYTKDPKIIPHKKTKVMNFSRIEKEGIKFISQVDSSVSKTEYESVNDGKSISIDYNIKYDKNYIDDIVDYIYEEFSARDWEGVTLKLSKNEYTQNNLPPKDVIKNIIIKSMRRISIKDNFLSNDNKQRVLQSFSTMLRKANNTTKIEPIINNLKVIKTLSMKNETIGINRLDSGGTIFYTANYKKELNDKSVDILNDLIKDKDNRIGSALQEVYEDNMKTPLNVIITNETPEREFVRKVIDQNNIKKIDSWIKSRDKNFYSIEYSVRKNNHQYIKSFNPDFFIKLKNKKDKTPLILVVEVKSDNDTNEDNIAKYKWAKNHFNNLNRELKKNKINQEYLFNFLSPNSYDEYFEKIKNDDIFDGFVSKLDVLLDQ